MADRIGTLLDRSGDGGEEVLIVSRGKARTRFRRRDELDWGLRVESTDSENIVEGDPKPARRASRPRGQRVAYVRVSAADQNEARQLEAVGECDRVYVEKQSARSRADRVKLAECIGYLRDGDELVVASMDRLARSLVDLKQIVGEITAKGASVEFVHERATYAAGAQDPRADLMLSLLGAFAEFERAIIRERQAEGIAIAKTKGKYKGRKRVLTNEQINKARARVEAGEGPSAIARDFGVGRSTLYRALHRHAA
jgi:DNA invertase Pin-like site-specific DNA recombinase